jgi:enoyl-CoA hydratase/carnithine racemase
MSLRTRDVDGGVRILMLDRPPANAFNLELMNDLRAACEAARHDDAVRAVVLTGNGKFFSGGLDLKMLSAGVVNPAWNPATFGRSDGVFALWTLPKPTVAMVNGHAIAGGAILALACDVRIAACDSCRIGLNELAIGIAPPRGAYEIAKLALTDRQLWKIGLGAELHDADAARALGLIDEVVEPADLERVCIARARRLGAYPRAAYAHGKRVFQHAAVQAVLNETEEQIRTLVEVWTSAETTQALLAQLSGISSQPQGTAPTAGS